MSFRFVRLKFVILHFNVFSVPIQTQSKQSGISTQREEAKITIYNLRIIQIIYIFRSCDRIIICI